MNFDDIQSAWNSDNDDRVVVPSSVDQLKTLQLPIEKLRTNMKLEFYVQLFSLILIGFLPRYTYFSPVFIIPFYAVYIVSMAISVYYFSKFYLFYNSISSVTLRSKDNLYALYYEARLNIEMYKSYAYTLIPFALIVLVMYMVSRQDEKFKLIFQATRDHQMMAIAISVVFIIGIVSIMVITEYWVKTYYGKYLKQIKKVLDEFKENA
jgi:hypothetical protein